MQKHFFLNVTAQAEAEVDVFEAVGVGFTEAVQCIEIGFAD
jgi:hypothetical protein